jgi:hypothetical protein
VILIFDGQGLKLSYYATIFTSLNINYVDVFARACPNECPFRMKWNMFFDYSKFVSMYRYSSVSFYFCPFHKLLTHGLPWPFQPQEFDATQNRLARENRLMEKRSPAANGEHKIDWDKIDSYKDGETELWLL